MVWLHVCVKIFMGLKYFTRGRVYITVITNEFASNNSQNNQYAGSLVPLWFFDNKFKVKYT